MDMDRDDEDDDDEMFEDDGEDVSDTEKIVETERPIYNPLNLPLGWDGKPIPFWLYKLHGLGIEYKCEICGNYSYWGRRAFERHFQEWRHAFGMRCLRIPNTAHFKEITKIEEARQGGLMGVCVYPASAREEPSTALKVVRQDN